MRRGGLRARKSWRVGTRKAADYLIMARIRDQALSSLITSFPTILGISSGESREPHITLFGPFRSLARGDAILTRVRDAASCLNRVSCTIGELVRLKGVRGGAVALSLSPGEDLAGFYRQLVARFPLLTTRCIWIDKAPGHRIFHISLRFNIPFREFDLIWKRVTELPPSPEYEPAGGKGTLPSLQTYLRACDSPLDIFRISVIRRGALWKEFDLPRRVWLSRKESADTGEWKKTLRTFRNNEGMELHGPAHGGSPQQFVISDLHLGHRNIIQYCRRPFSSSDEMDEVLIRNWNHRIAPSDEVFYLGDLCHGKCAKPASAYLSRLNGLIQVISGNHDEEIPGAVPSLRLQYGTTDFFFIHDPVGAPDGFPGWIVHGHLHNNDIVRYPFINAGTRSINVSAELLDYIPVSLQELCGFLTKVQSGEKILSLKEARARYSSRYPANPEGILHR
ncbi:MAG: 2'-5' RNA ligase family protein [Methanoregulaceae archaeon]|nr:2'-5' RNA ligase family protein [Methanoregulaceae archaeon]